MSLSDELAKVHHINKQTLIDEHGFTPMAETYDPHKGSFVSVNPNTGLYAAMWVKDGTMLSTIPAIMGYDLDEVKKSSCIILSHS